MKRTERILVELLAPPFLAMICVAVTTFKISDGIEIVPTFLFVLVFAYLFSMIPALIYTSLMEVWFRSGLRTRFGLACTVAFSSLLATGAGFLACLIGTWLGPMISFDCRNFAFIGGACGLLVGFYVACCDNIGE